MTESHQGRERVLEEQETALIKREAELAAAVANLSCATERQVAALAAEEARIAADREALDASIKAFSEQSREDNASLELGRKEVDVARAALAQERAELLSLQARLGTQEEVLTGRARDLDAMMLAVAGREKEAAAEAVRIANEQQSLDLTMKAHSAVFEEDSQNLSLAEEALRLSQCEVDERLLRLKAEASDVEAQRNRLHALSAETDARREALEKAVADHKDRVESDEANIAERRSMMAHREEELTRAEGERARLIEELLQRESTLAAAEVTHRTTSASLRSREENAVALEKSAADKISALESKVQDILRDQASLKKQRSDLEDRESQLLREVQHLHEQRRMFEEQREAHGASEHRLEEIAHQEEALRGLQQLLDAKAAKLTPFFGTLSGSEFQQHHRNRWLQAPGVNALRVDEAFNEVKDIDASLPPSSHNIAPATWRSWIAEPWKEGWALWLQEQHQDDVATPVLLEAGAMFVADHWCLLDTVVPRGSWQFFVRMVVSLSRQAQPVHCDVCVQTLSRLMWVAHGLGKVYRQLFAALTSAERLAVLVATVAAALEQPAPSSLSSLDSDSITIGSDAFGAAAQRAVLRGVMCVLCIPQADITELIDDTSARTFHGLLSTLIVQAAEGPTKRLVASCVDHVLTLGLPLPHDMQHSTMHIEFVLLACTQWSRSAESKLVGVITDIARATSKSLDPSLLSHVALVKGESPINAAAFGSLLTTEVQKLLNTLGDVRLQLQDAESQRDAARDAVAAELAAAKERNFNAHKLEMAASERLAEVTDREAAVALLEVRLAEVQRRERETTDLYHEAVEIQVRNSYQGVLPAEKERLQKAAEVIAARELGVREAAAAAHMKSQQADMKLKQIEDAEDRLAQKQQELILLQERMEGIELRESALERREEAYVRLMASSRHTAAKTLVNTEWENRLALRTEEVDAALRYARQTSTKLEKELKQQITRREEFSAIQECEESVRRAVDQSRERRLHAAQGFTVSRSEHTAHRPIDRLERAVFQLTSTLASCAGQQGGAV
jgi:hypothetical protein